MQAATSGNGQRIAFAFPEMLPLGGAERVQIDLARELHALGFAIDIVMAYETQDVSQYFPPGTRVFSFGTPRTRDFIRPFTAYLRAERPAAVIAAMWPFTSACILAARLARSRTAVLVSEHNMLSIQYAGQGWLHRAAMRLSIALTYPFASARVAVSFGVVEDLGRLGWLRSGSVNVIHNPVFAPVQILEQQHLVKARLAWGSTSGACLLAVGRLKAQKNYPLLLEALSHLLQRRDAHLVILGTGPDKEEIEHLILSAGLVDHVSLFGHVDDPMPYYSCADLFVLSSDYEGFGNVIVEAMSCGTPVVSTDCPSGPSEILEGGALGRLVPVGDASALATAMEAELDAPHAPEDLIRRAADFTPAIAARRYLELLLPDFAARKIVDN